MTALEVQLEASLLLLATQDDARFTRPTVSEAALHAVHAQLARVCRGDVAKKKREDDK